jgi:hypothetical protein
MDSENRVESASGAAAPKRLGELLVESGIISQAQLGEALAEQSAEPTAKRIGEILLQDVSLTPDQLEKALAKQQQDPSKKIGDILVAMGVVRPEELRGALERQRSTQRPKLGEVLVRRGWVAAKTIADALRSQELGISLVRAGAAAAIIAMALGTPSTTAHAVANAQVEATDVFYGNAESFATPAVVCFETAIKATPEYKQIKEKEIFQGSGQYTVLVAQASDRVHRAIENVASDGNYDLIAAAACADALSSETKATDITNLIIKAMK